MTRGRVRRWLARIRLRAVWILAPIYLILARPSVWLIAAGALLALLGGALRAWAAGTIRKNVVLTTGGPYAHTRNPLYLGTFFMGLGLAVAGGRFALALMFLLVFWAVYGWTMREEARQLEERFGEKYRDYAARVPLFFPRLHPYTPGAAMPTRFRLDRYLGHREYQAALGLLLGFLALLVKLAWSE